MLSAPEYLDDVAPPQAAALARARERGLAWLAAHDYALVGLPLADYLETLTGGDAELDLHTFKITDTLSGRTLGIRADQTPQIARFDAARASKPAVRRYCYCGPALRARPPQPWLGRESLQLGAELLGAPAVGGDWEVASVALGMLRAMGVEELCVDVGHAGLFAAIRAHYKDAQVEWREAMALVARRDAAGLAQLRDDGMLCDAALAALQALAQTAGAEEEAGTLTTPRRALPASAAAALDEVAAVARRLHGEGWDCAFNLSDLGSYGYHTGVVFTVYGADRIVARGGRYRLPGGDEGVGFSVDLRQLVELAPSAPAANAVNVPTAIADDAWLAAVAQLRAAGRAIRFCHDGAPSALPALRQEGDAWRVEETGAEASA